MAVTVSIPNVPAVIAFVEQLRQGVAKDHISVIRTPDGDDLVVMRPEHLSDLQTVVNDPSFISALEQGLADLAAGRVHTLLPGEHLSDLVARVTAGPEIVAAIEEGLEDIAAGRVQVLKNGRPLSDLS